MSAGLLDAAGRFGTILVELLVLFLAVAFVLAIVQRRWITPQRLRHAIGGRGRVMPLLKGALLGAVTPFCSCAGVPVLAGLLRARVRFGTAAAFLLASPLMNPVLLGVVALLFGPRIAVGYAVVVLPATLLAAAVWEAVGLASDVKVGGGAREPVPAYAGATGGSDAGAACASPEASCGSGRGPDESADGVAEAGEPAAHWQGWRAEVPAAASEALSTLRPVLLPLLLAVTAGALIYGAVPEATIARVAGEGAWLAIPAAALIGIPLYVRGEAALPIGYALLSAGAGIGPVFAMVVAAAGASLPEVVLLSGLFRRRLLAVFVASVLTVAIVAGTVIPLLA